MSSKKLNFASVVLICLTMSLLFGDFIVAQNPQKTDGLLKGKNRIEKSENSDETTLSPVKSKAFPTRSDQLKSEVSAKRIKSIQNSPKQPNLEIRTHGGDIQLRTFGFNGQT